MSGRLGYESPSGLTELFRRIHGTTPSAEDAVTVEVAARHVIAALDPHG